MIKHNVMNYSYEALFAEVWQVTMGMKFVSFLTPDMA